MLFYLDNWQSAASAEAETATGMNARGQRPGRRGMRAPQRPQAQRPQTQNRRRGINENYARELMELHTLGVDGGYTQKDVQEVARAFTGWTIERPRQGGGFRFDPRMHDNGAKTVLGVTIPRGGGKRDGEQVLDILAKHPSTARFIATKLARRFVADEPPPGARRSGRGALPRDRRRHPRGRADDRDLARVLRPVGDAGEGEDAARVRRERRARHRRPTSGTGCRSCRRCASSACRSTCASRRPATPTPPTPG